MRARVRIFMVPAWIVIWLAFCYATVLALTPVLAWWLKVSPEVVRPIFSRLELPALIFWGVVYGLYRGAAYHPVKNLTYWTWLANSPWRPPMSLPLGPVHLVWQDALPMAIPAILCATVTHAHPAIPLIAMLAAYLLLLTFYLAQTAQFEAFAAFLYLFPVTWYAWARGWLVLGMLVAFYLLALHGLNRSWRRFPWDLHERLAKGRQAPGPTPSLGWPFDRLNGCEPAKAPSPSTIAAGSLTLGWFVFSFLHCIDSPDLRPDNTMAMMMMIGLFVAFIRMVVYCSKGAPPLTVLGRIVQGRLIIAGYDQMFVAPIMIALVAILGPLAMRHVGIYPPLMAGIMTAVLLAMALGLPPTLRNWQLTGQFRMITTKRRPAAAR